MESISYLNWYLHNLVITFFFCFLIRCDRPPQKILILYSLSSCSIIHNKVALTYQYSIFLCWTCQLIYFHKYVNDQWRAAPHENLPTVSAISSRPYLVVMHFQCVLVWLHNAFKVKPWSGKGLPQIYLVLSRPQLLRIVSLSATAMPSGVSYRSFKTASG